MNKKLSIVLTGGGTGGHIYPALAIAQKLKNDTEINNIYYIGCDKNPEKDIINKEGIKFYSINVSGMPRKVSLKLLFWFLELISATLKAVYYLLKLKPDLVFGTGGYVTGPVLIAAWLLRIPYAVHDPDAHPGIVNRYTAGGARFVSLAFEQAKNYINNPNSIIFGNPARESLKSINKETAVTKLGLNPKKKTILIIGGSQGAKTINEAALDAVPVFINDSGFQVIHQTGKRNFTEYENNFYEKYPELRGNSSYLLQPYYDDMALALNAADVAISRAGSLSISELNLCELPSILIPFPYAAADHQRYNAKAMEKAGASIYLEDHDCTSEKLIELVNSILSHPDKYEQMKQANKSLAKPDSVDKIIKALKKMV